MKVDLGNHRKARIDMLPLIDIVFLLLVFFIYAMLSMAVHHALPVALPVSSTGSEKDPGVLLFADNSITYQTLYGVIDQIKMAGISRLSLECERQP
ncbi:MAG: biopolymer transporter ExbD [Desulfosarcina sp.]|nr:biopolymer transporter ExbD [Desulfosarcina sp.]